MITKQYTTSAFSPPQLGELIQIQQLFPKKLPMPPVSPWVVLRRELRPVLRRGVVIQPELDEPARLGVLKPRLAQMIERADRRPLRIGDDAVDRLLPVDIRLMLKVPAEGIAHRLQYKRRHRNDKQQHNEAG